MIEYILLGKILACDSGRGDDQIKNHCRIWRYLTWAGIMDTDTTDITDLEGTIGITGFADLAWDLDFGLISVIIAIATAAWDAVA